MSKNPIDSQRLGIIKRKGTNCHPGVRAGDADGGPGVGVGAGARIGISVGIVGVSAGIVGVVGCNSVISRIRIKEMSTTARVEEMTLLVECRPLGYNQLFQGDYLGIGFEVNMHATMINGGGGLIS